MTLIGVCLPTQLMYPNKDHVTTTCMHRRRNLGALGAVAPPIFYSPLCSPPHVERGLHTSGTYAQCKRNYLVRVLRMRRRGSSRDKVHQHLREGDIDESR